MMWTEEEVQSALERKEAEHNFERIDVDLIDPGKCQTDFGWDSWQIAFMNKLSATMGAAKVCDINCGCLVCQSMVLQMSSVTIMVSSRMRAYLSQR